MQHENQIEISVVSQYVEAQSEPSADRYVFAYTIEISNHGEQTCQLLNRHWVITDGTGSVEEVRGEGVVGKQPTLAPGESFKYTSGAILKTPVGTMQGSYEFSEVAAGALFDVPIQVFSLTVPSMVH
ncbi:MAG: Co2+/Mg2+ efflux protein ApaG [Pseudomonadales bacterium]